MKIEVNLEDDNYYPSDYWINGLHIHRATLHRWRVSGKVDGVRIGGKWWFRGIDFLRLEKEYIDHGRI